MKLGERGELEFLMTVDWIGRFDSSDHFVRADMSMEIEFDQDNKIISSST